MMDKLDTPSILLIISAFGAMVISVISSFFAALMAYQAKAQATVNLVKLDENTKLTTAAVASNGEIKSLVNGTQTALLQKLNDTQAMLNAQHAEVRSLRAQNAALGSHLDDARRPPDTEVSDKREAQQDRREERQDQRDIRQVERSHNHSLVGDASSESANGVPTIEAPVFVVEKKP